MIDPLPDSTLVKMAENALASTMLPPMPYPQPGAVRFVVVAEVFPDEDNALVASASTMALTAPASDWLKSAAERLNTGVLGYIQGFRYNEIWHDLHRKEEKP